MFKQVKKIHFTGIGGIGMSALAKLLNHQGYQITGSDLSTSSIIEDLKKEGVKVFLEQKTENLDYQPEILIYSSAVKNDNPERQYVQKHKINEYSYAEALGLLTQEYQTIAVSGTNGKSTTTAMLGKILIKAGLDPTVLVGTYVPGFNHGNLQIGQSQILVIEACEYQANMLNLNPDIILLTNIEEDHLDYYRDLNHIRETFQKFLDKLNGPGKAIINLSDSESRKLKTENPITYALNQSADFYAIDQKNKDEHQKFTVFGYGEIELAIPGLFNIANALGALSTALKLGVTFDQVAQALKEFTGVWRRFERVGQFNGAEIISDYAHHPSAIKGTLQGLKDFFPHRRLIVCFQPHQHSRTKELFNDFVRVLSKVDHLIIPEIYTVPGRTEKEVSEVSSLDLVKKISGNDVEYASDLKKAERILRKKIQANDVVIIMGAGDIDQIARNLVKTNK